MSGKKCYQFTEDQKFQLITAWGNEEVLHDSLHLTISTTEDEENSAEISIADVETCMRCLWTQRLTR